MPWNEEKQYGNHPGKILKFSLFSLNFLDIPYYWYRWQLKTPSSIPGCSSWASDGVCIVFHICEVINHIQWRVMQTPVCSNFTVYIWEMLLNSINSILHLGSGQTYRPSKALNCFKVKLSSKILGCWSDPKWKPLSVEPQRWYLFFSVSCALSPWKKLTASFHLQRYDWQLYLPLTSYSIHYELSGKAEFLF